MTTRTKKSPSNGRAEAIASGAGQVGCSAPLFIWARARAPQEPVRGVRPARTERREPEGPDRQPSSPYGRSQRHAHCQRSPRRDRQMRTHRKSAPSKGAPEDVPGTIGRLIGRGTRQRFTQPTHASHRGIDARRTYKARTKRCLLYKRTTEWANSASATHTPLRRRQVTDRKAAPHRESVCGRTNQIRPSRRRTHAERNARGPRMA